MRWVITGFYIFVPLLLAAALLRIILAVRTESGKSPIIEDEEERKSWPRHRIVMVIVASIAIIMIITGVVMTPFALGFGGLAGYRNIYTHPGRVNRPLWLCYY